MQFYSMYKPHTKLDYRNIEFFNKSQLWYYRVTKEGYFPNYFEKEGKILNFLCEKGICPFWPKFRLITFFFFFLGLSYPHLVKCITTLANLSIVVVNCICCAIVKTLISILNLYLCCKCLQATCMIVYHIFLIKC